MKTNKFYFTDAKIRSLTPTPGKQVEVWDEKIPNFGCRVSPKGSKAFFLLYRYHGRSRRFTIGHYPILSLSDARKKAIAALTEVTKGGDPAAAKKESKNETHSFSYVIDEFIEKHAQPRNKSWKETQRILKKDFVEQWKNKDVRELTKHDVLKILDRIAKNHPSAANHAYRAINKFFNWSVERDIIAVSPTHDLSLPCKIEKRDRVLSDNELKAIWDAATELAYPYGIIIQLLILTGQRRGEISELRWGQINFEEKVRILPAELNKSGREHRLPLSPKVLEIISSVPRTDDKWLFPARNSTNSVSGFSKWKTKIDNLSGVENWTVHDIRRTVATGLAKAEVELHVIEKILNHSTGKLGGIAGLYNKHSYEKEMLSALLTWDQFIADNIASK